MAATIALPPLLDSLRRAVGNENVLAADSDLMVYECDGFTIEKNSPDVVVFPRDTADVAEIVKICNATGVPFLPRGAGTSLAGGCLPVGGGVMIVLTRMKRILEINLRDRYAIVELGVEAVMADGRIVRLGGPVEDPVGFDLVGAVVGSEGTLAIVTKVWVRLTKNPQGHRTMLGVFESVDDATTAISEIIGAGIVPAALEMMDQGILEAVEAAFHFGFPLDAQAILLIEVDGLEAGLDQQRDEIVALCKQCGAR